MGFTIFAIKRSFVRTVGVFGLLALAMGCAKPISSSDVNSAQGGNDPCCVRPPAPPTPPSMDPVDGTISEGLYQGEQVFHIDPVERMLTLKVPILGAALMPGFYAQAPVPGLPGAWLEMVPLGNGDGGLELHLPLELLTDHIDIRDSKKLPNGDPLPVVPGGELPAFAVAMHPSPDIEVIVYVGPEAVAVLFWSPFDTVLKLTGPIYMEGQPHPVGWFHAIPHKREGGKIVYPRGGFLVGVSLPSELRRQLNDLF